MAAEWAGRRAPTVTGSPPVPTEHPNAKAEGEILSVGSVWGLGVIQMFPIENWIPNNCEFSTAQLITCSL